MAFFAGLGTGGVGIFTGNGGPVTTIADSSGPFGGFSNANSLNDSGTVAFTGSLDTGEEGIFTGSGGPTTTIVDSSGPFGGFSNANCLNNSGTVAFTGGLDTGEQGIFTGSGGPVTTIADSSGPFFQFGLPSLNNSGTVAFHADLDTGEQGIFTGPDPLMDKVILTGDPLFGSTVASLFRGFQCEMLNDTGQIAFLYTLADGRQGIARADPLVVPEPGTLSCSSPHCWVRCCGAGTNQALVRN